MFLKKPTPSGVLLPPWLDQKKVKNKEKDHLENTTKEWSRDFKSLYDLLDI